MISVALPASFSRIASSTAISSKGFIDIFTLASSTPEPSALTRILMSLSTTRFTGTTIFMFLVSSSGHFAPESGPGIGAPHPNRRLIRGQRCSVSATLAQRRVPASVTASSTAAQSFMPVRRSRNTRSSAPNFDDELLAAVGALHHGQAVVQIDHQRVAVLAAVEDQDRRPPRALIASNTSGCADCMQTMPASFG